MDKRLPIALLLSLVVFVAWEYFFAPKRPPPRPQAPPAAGAPQEPARAPTAPPAAVPDAPALGERIADTEVHTLELRIGTPGKPGSYFARFTNEGARLLELRLGDSFDQPRLSEAERLDLAHWTHLVDSVRSKDGPTGSLGWRAHGQATAYERGPLDRALWKMEVLGPAGAPEGVQFDLQPGSGVHFRKRITFVPGTYELSVELSIANEAAETAGPATFLFTPAEVVPHESGDSMYIEPLAVAAGRGETRQAQPELEVKERDDSGSTRSGAFALPTGPQASLSFGGGQNKYFAVVARGDARSAPTLRGALWRLVNDQEFAAADPENAAKSWRYVATDLLLQLQVPERGQTASWIYTVYAGPKDPDTLLAAHPDHRALLEHDLGSWRWFLAIANFLLAVLNFFHGLAGNWGVAVILLTISVRLVLFPLNRRSQTAMARYQAKMKRIQPLIEALKKRHEKDPAKLRQEQTLLMQKEGAFPPLGGCLPMFLQIPVFFGLFSALRASYDLRQAPFVGWIKDLARPDELFEINLHLPFIGNIQYFNLLPPLMVVLWVLQQRLMPKPTEEQALKMYKMMMVMPIFMGFFLYNYAAGLSLYMITQSTLGIIEQQVIKRVWPLDMTEQPRKEGGFWSRMAKLQEEQAKRVNQTSGAKARRR